jgi:serine phosphatase RsbU (regulator of sigma subunit)
MLARTARGAAELLGDIDEAASSGLRHEMRANATVLVVDADGSRAEVALAGGTCMKLSGAGGGAAWCPGEGRPLGVRVPGTQPAPPVTVLFNLEPGDAALLVTSGCLSARSATGERYGARRVEAFARANFRTAPADFAGSLAADIKRFRTGSTRAAEGCIAIIRRKPAS